MAYTTRSTETGPVAILHHVGGVWRGLMVRASASDAEMLRVLDVGEFTDGDASGSLDAWLEEYDASRVISVLPASSVICRTVTLPNAEPAQLDQALRLQAESHLLGVAPQHRTAMSVLPSAPRENARAGLIVAWPENARGPQPPTQRAVTYVPDVACLAGLLGSQRPGDPVLWLDRGTASIAITLSHANGLVYRATRESSEDEHEWRDSVARIVGETAVNVGHSAGFVQSIVAHTRELLAQRDVSGQVLMIPEEVIETVAARLEGVTTDRTWWSTYGIAAGAALAAHGPLAGLTRIIADKPIEDPSPMTVIANRLAQPRTAARVLVVCALLLAITPLAFSGLRLQLLKWRFGDVNETLQQVERAQSTLAMYRHFDQNAWSMTKLLSDIACNTPDGLEVNSIRLNQQNENIRIDGRAKPQGDNQTAKDVVAQMQRQLADTYIFDNIELDWKDPDAFGIYEFSLSASVARPHYQFNYPDELDYGRYTVADRRDGNEPRTREQIVQLMTTAERGLRSPDRALLEGGGSSAGDASYASANRRAGNGASGAPDRGVTRPPRDASNEPAPNADAGRDRERMSQAEREAAQQELEQRTSRPERRRRQGMRESGDVNQRSEQRSGGAGVPDRMVVPDPITQEQVNQMNKAELRDQLTKVATARQHNRDDEELQERLRKEQQMILQRLRELR